eukprot:GHVL01001147.1.p1 GENE.GHVL01001147.1~~GHVL01001147.1.p1  ORF type:complete len:178 (+),score=40.13 GHVL01001147.1:58-591(+)
MIFTESDSTDTEHGIPRAVFIENIEEFLNNEEPQKAMLQSQELLRKYQIMESSFLAQRSNLKGKQPEIVQCIEAVEYLLAKQNSEEPVEITYPLADHIYSKAILNKSESVCVWLGANCMLEYPIPDALKLLTTSFNSCVEKIKNLSESIDFLREQITTCEVNQRRIINYSIKIKAKN